MVKKRDGTSTYNYTNIWLNQLTREKIRTLPGSLSSNIKMSIDHTFDSPFAVISVENEINGKMLYTVLRTKEYYKNDYLLYLFGSDSRIGIDIKESGILNFNKKLNGSFSSEIEALNYRDFLINNKLNEGKFIYNIEDAPRYLFCPIDHNHYDSIVKLCTSKNVLIENVLSKYVVKLLNKYL